MWMVKFVRTMLTSALFSVTAVALGNAQPPSEKPINYSDLVLQVVQSHFDRLRECFQEATERKDQAIPQKLSALFNVGKFGSVQSVTFEEEAQISAELNQCIVARISYFQFPAREDSAGTKPVRLVLNFAVPGAAQP